MSSNVNITFKKKIYNSTTDSTSGTIIFDKSTKKIYVEGECYSSDVKNATFDSNSSILTITKSDNSNITVDFSAFERKTNKATSLSSSSTHTQYPSAKCVYDYSKDKPKSELVWETQSVNDGILASETDISQNPNWQITNLDMTKYQKVKLYIRSGGSGTDITPSVVMKIDLGGLNKSPFGHFIGSTIGVNPNNNNRLFAVSAAISEDKTSVFFNRSTSLYNTAATSVNSDGRVLYKIVGYTGGEIGHDFQIKGPSDFTGKNFILQSKYDGNQVTSQWSIISGGQYATVNQWGRVDIEPGTANETIVVQAVYGGLSETITIQITYDNQLIISCPDTITGVSGSCVATYNNNGCVPVWSIINGNANAIINEYGEITILQSGDITIQAVYNGYTTTKEVTLEYQSGVVQETVINEDGSITETTTTETTDPTTGSTTTTTTTTTTNEDGSTSHVESETTENTDGSSTTQTTTTNEDGSSSESTTEVSAPDPNTGSVTSTSTTTNYDENGDTTGSQSNVTTENTDGSSTSTTINYNAEGDPTTQQNQDTDSSNNVNTQDITYNEQGEPEVTGYSIDTSGNTSGTGEEITGDGINTEFVPFDDSNEGFICHIRFRTVKTEQPNPPLVEDTEDKGSNYLFNILTAKSPFKPYRGFHIRWALSKKNYSSGNLTLGYTSDSANSTTSRQIYGINDVYDFNIIYDPNLLYYPSKFRVEDLQGRTSTITANIDFATNNMDFVLGYAINQNDEPYRYSNVTIYEFSLSRLVPPS